MSEVYVQVHKTGSVQVNTLVPWCG